MEHAELVAVCDRDKERAEAGKARFGVPAFTSVQDMIAGAKLDMVSVATAGHEYGRDHYEPTMEALEAGLHVLGEKPICNEIPLAEAMVAKARYSPFSLSAGSATAAPTTPHTATTASAPTPR